MTWCESHAVDDVFGLAKNARLIALIAEELTEAAATCTATQQPARVFAELTYETLDSWTCARRVVAKAEPLTAATVDGEGKRNPRFVVTPRAMTDIDARTLYEDIYRARGEMENRIKEQPLMLFADRTSATTPASHAPRTDFYRTTRSRWPHGRTHRAPSHQIFTTPRVASPTASGF